MQPVYSSVWSLWCHGVNTAAPALQSLTQSRPSSTVVSYPEPTFLQGKVSGDYWAHTFVVVLSQQSWFLNKPMVAFYDVALIHCLASNTCMYDVAPFHWFVQNQDCWTKKVLNSHQTLSLMRGWGSAWVQDYQPCDLSSCVNSQPLGGTFVYNYINCNDMIRCLIASATMLSHDSHAVNTL